MYPYCPLSPPSPPPQAALALSLCLTLPLDGYLWGRPVWPEASSVGFNLVQGRAAEWGLSPWHWYATSALPRALLAALPLAPAGWVVERRVRPLLGCGLLYVALYSLVGHKELRFLFPALPLFNAAAAPALARAARDRGRRPVAFVAACLLLGATLGAKALLAAAAAHNYPGGWALRAAAEALGGGGGMRLHVAVGAAQTGVTRFGHPSAWSVSKAEGLTDAQLAGAGYTHLLSDRGDVPGFERLAATHGFTRFAPAPRTPWRPLRLLTEPRVYLHRRLAQGEEGGEDDVTPGSSA